MSMAINIINKIKALFIKHESVEGLSTEELASNHQFDRYLHNPDLTHIGYGNVQDSSYPLAFVDTNNCIGCDLTNGDIYTIQTSDDFEYVLVAVNNQAVISAYDTTTGIKTRVGAAGYHYVSDDKGLYLDNLVVCLEYRRRHIATQILKSIINVESEYLEHHNIFVHASASPSLEHTPNQIELEHFYESNGYTLVHSEGDLFLRDITIKPVVSENLLRIVHESMNNHME